MVFSAEDVASLVKEILSQEDTTTHISEIMQERELDEVALVPKGDADVLWFVLGGILVFFMQAGFGMLEVGMVNVKNTKNILIKNLFDASIGAICWYFLGWGFAYGTLDGVDSFSGKAQFFGVNLTDFEKKDWFFQWAFAATTATIVSGAVAERVSFGCYIVYTIFLTSFIYPIVVHAGWATGSWGLSSAFFNGCLHDFAGSAIVHLCGGVAALVAAIIIGPRIGRFDAGVTLPQQSVIFQTLGTLILWFGWYGFNGASTLGIAGNGELLAHVCMTTTLSASAGCLATTGLGYLLTGIIDIGNANNGILAGLVGITAGADVVDPIGAILIGAFSSVIYLGSSKLLELCKIDDVVGAIPIHGFCGLYGTVMVGLFSTKERYSDECAGIFYGGNGDGFMANLVFCLFVIGWTFACTLVLFLGCKFTIGVRVSKEVEEAGMDSSKHGGMVFTGAVPATSEEI